LKVIVN